MANWKYKLDIKDEWKACKNGDITCKDLIPVIVNKLKALNIHDSELENIIDDFEILAEDEVDPDEFDCIWNDLYNWADQEVAPFGKYPRNKMMWINTF